MFPLHGDLQCDLLRDGRIAAPACVRRYLFALHQEGVRGEHRAVAHRHPVVDVRAGPERAAVADRGVLGLEGAVLLRVRLDLAQRVERAVAADGGERALGDVAAVVEDPRPIRTPSSRQTTLLNGVPLNTLR